MMYVYKLMDGDEVVYVGKTKDPQQRVAQHRVDKKFDSVFVSQCSDVNKVEKELIGYYKPKYNCTHRNRKVGQEPLVEWTLFYSEAVNKDYSQIPLALLGKKFSGIEIDIELAVLWVCMYNRAAHFGLECETLESLRTVLHLKKFKAATLLQKLIQAGVVKADLIVKNKGVKKGNEDKAPKRWLFTYIKNPMECLKD